MTAYLECTSDINPFQTVQLLLENNDLKSYSVYQDYKITEDKEKEIAILVFEKLFIRNGSSGSLTVIVDNFSQITQVKCISSGTGQGLLNIDWRAGKSFINLIKNQLDSHIMEITKEDTE
ncbi:MAG: DUF6054 family protein [Bacillota bacterium]|nr:DUF6054 family protein [Bacillota bacterium]